jgi:SAM-dependent methyltransferase
MSDENLFFEGKDFPGRPFKALMPEFYPPEYQEYIRQESELIRSKVKGKNRVLDAGVGIGRLVPVIAPEVIELVGVDKAELMLRHAEAAVKTFPNTRLIRGELEHLSHLFPPDYFDSAICAWNTLGNVDEEVRVLREMKLVTKGDISCSVFLKGTLSSRENWYRTVGVLLDRVDPGTETVYTATGLRSRSYSLEDMELIASGAGLRVVRSKVLNGLVLWVELQS